MMKKDVALVLSSGGARGLAHIGAILELEAQGYNYYTVLSRVNSIMIRQNSMLMAQMMKPDIPVDIQLSRYSTFDFDKSEKLIAIGQKKTAKALC